MRKLNSLIRPVTVKTVMLALAVALGVALAGGRMLPDLLAEIPTTIDVEDPVDRRAFDVPSPAESSTLPPSWREAKKAEARAMLRWFEAKLAMVKIEVEKQAIEHKFNEANYARLRSIPGAVAGISLLEAEKRTELDDLLTRQLQAMKEMAEADVAAARARLDSIEAD